MQNIEIKRTKNKRSIQSLIEDSAIDASFNHEAHELKRAFNQTIAAMNIKHLEREKETQKFKIMLREQGEIRQLYEKRIRLLEEELYMKNRQNSDLVQSHKQAKKKLQYLEYKMETINQNRNLLEIEQSNYDEPTERDAQKKKKMKNEIYTQFSKMIIKKVDYFTSNMKKITISPEAEQTIQTFLEELIYINPYSQFHIAEQIKQEKREQMMGKIIKDGNLQKEQEQDSWMMLEKSLQKLKNVNPKQRRPLPVSSQLQSPNFKDRSVSPSRRRPLFQQKAKF